MSGIGDARKEFPTFKEFIYVDVAGRNPLSDRVRAAIDGYLDQRQRGEDRKQEWLDHVEKVRAKVATLLHASADEVAFVKNTSDGINSVIACLDWQPGDNVIIAPDFEHPNNVYAWLNLRRLGVEVRTLTLSGPVVTKSMIVEACDTRTKAVGIASVSFATGGRADISGIGEFCRQRGIFLMVDAVQSLGVFEFDVGKAPVSALASATSKGLLGLYGLGVLYCRRELAEKMHPRYLARYSVDLGDSHEEVLGDFSYNLAAGAKRFEIGNFNYLAIHALDAALDHILEAGVPNIQEHVLALSGALTKGIAALGYRLRSSQDPAAMSNIVLFTPPPAGAAVQKLSGYLNEHKVRHSVRRGAVRMSFHLYNNMEDVEYILSVLKNARF
jgi:selenocysteine lyase/cysteine desulfurase